MPSLYDTPHYRPPTKCDYCHRTLPPRPHTDQRACLLLAHVCVAAIDRGEAVLSILATVPFTHGRHYTYGRSPHWSSTEEEREAGLKQFLDDLELDEAPELFFDNCNRPFGRCPGHKRVVAEPPRYW